MAIRAARPLISAAGTGRIDGVPTTEDTNARTWWRSVPRRLDTCACLVRRQLDKGDMVASPDAVWGFMEDHHRLIREEKEVIALGKRGRKGIKHDNDS